MTRWGRKEGQLQNRFGVDFAMELTVGLAAQTASSGALTIRLP
jgi:hypothetical protein